MRKIQLVRWVTGAAAVLQGVLSSHAFGAAGAEPPESLSEVIVTATRTREQVDRVPISVQAFTAEDMAKAGTKQFEDFVRLSPGLTLNPTFAGGTNIAIRGIGSNAGSATTGIYIDDVPIQVRNLGYSASALYPRIFDLERLEVLRGPQGTLFGAGSEGGTVRFILPKPSLDGYTSLSRLELSSTAGGAASYEVGESLGGPIVAGSVGFRASAYYRHDGGWIDRVGGGTPDVLDPTGAAYGGSAVLTGASIAARNSNYEDAAAFRLALRIDPSENLTLMPWVFFQRQRSHDEIGSFWLMASDPGHGRFAAPLFSQIPGFLNPTGTPDLNAGDANLTLPALELEWKLGGMNLYSTTSYLITTKHQYVDSTTAYLQSYNLVQYPQPGYKAPDHNVDRSRTFAQEIRLQSADEGRWSWLVGLFYSHARQYSQEDIHPNFFDTIPSYFGIPNLDNADPFGPGSTNFQNIWGAPLLANSASYLAAFTSVDRQEAVFGQVTFKPAPGLSLTAGARFARNSFDFDATFAGPENNLNAPFGSPCPTVTPCVFNDPNGYWAPQYAVGTAGTSETSVTPRVSVSYQIDERHLLYASASKGYRPGGGELPLPTVCNDELVSYGYADASGKAKSPLTYGSDNVWSYEVGTKDHVWGDLLYVDLNAYWIKWRGVQAQVVLPVCGYGFTDNFGNATSKGVDLSLFLKPAEHLTVGLNASYNSATFDQSIQNSDGSIIIFRKGESLPQAGAPWNASVMLDYSLQTPAVPLYVHLDYTYTGRYRPTGSAEPGTVNYQPLLRPNAKYDQINARIGAVFGAVDVALFVDNLTDAAPYQGMFAPRDPFGIGSAAFWTARTLRPRTVGVNCSIKF